MTTESVAGAMEKSTGVPPHIELATQMSEILQQLTLLAQVQHSQASTLVATIEKAIDEKACDSGSIAGSRMNEALSQHQLDIARIINNRLASVDVAQDHTKFFFYRCQWKQRRNVAISTNRE